MCKEHQVALKVINSYIDAGTSFTFDQITKEIIDRGGILRVSIGITIKMYLKNLKEIGLLVYDVQDEKYTIHRDALKENCNMV